MAEPLIEFFTDTVNDVDYMNIGLVWTDEIPGMQDVEKRAVIGAIQGVLTQDQMKIIAGIAEEACRWVLGLNEQPPTLEVVGGGGSNLES